MKVITIGRSSQNDLTINDPKVSRHHCQIVQHDDGSFTLADFGSLNGTYVNGQRIYGEVRLNPKDEIRIGYTDLPWDSYFRPIVPPRRKSKALPIVLGVLGGVTLVAAIVVTITILLFFKGDKYKSEPHPLPNPVEQTPIAPPTLDNGHENDKSTNGINLAGNWEWVSDKMYEVEMVDEDMSRGMSRVGCQLVLKDDGTYITGEYHGGYLEDVLGDGTDGGTLEGTWDGEKYIVSMKSSYYGNSGKATIRPISSHKLEFRLITENGFMPDHVQMKRVKCFESNKNTKSSQPSKPKNDCSCLEYHLVKGGDSDEEKLELHNTCDKDIRVKGYLLNKIASRGDNNKLYFDEIVPASCNEYVNGFIENECTITSVKIISQ